MDRLNVVVPSSLLESIEQLTAKYGLTMQEVAQAVLGLSHRYTKDRASLGEPYMDDLRYTTAYLRYFLPVNYAKILILLDEIPKPARGEKFSVLDIGSGPGTGALAVLEWWRRAKLGGRLNISAVDRSCLALGQAAALWQAYCRTEAIEGVTLRICEADVECKNWYDQHRSEAPFDLVILANCINELHGGAKDPIAARAGFIKEILGLVSPHGTVMIVEPAMRETSREILRVRDRVLREAQCNVFSPCLHEHQCPALANPSDWCHEERDWETPASIRDLDRVVGFLKDALKFSYLLLRKDGKTIVDRRPDVFRVVSELRELKGEKRAWLCNQIGRQEVGRQDRMASPFNAAFDQWHRGDIVWIDTIRHKKKQDTLSALGRVDRNATVRIIRSV